MSVEIDKLMPHLYELDVSQGRIHHVTTDEKNKWNDAAENQEGFMAQSVYDSNNNGMVDNAENAGKLQNMEPSELPISDATQTALDTKMNINVYDTNNNGIVDNSEKLSGYTVNELPISDATQTALDGKEDAFTKNTAFNKNFGTGHDDVCRGDDPRLDATGDMEKSVYDINDNGIVDNSEKLSGYTPSELPISDATQIALSGKEDAFTKNTGFNKDFGTTSGTVVEGDDIRIYNIDTKFVNGLQIIELPYDNIGYLRLNRYSVHLYTTIRPSVGGTILYTFSGFFSDSTSNLNLAGGYTCVTPGSFSSIELQGNIDYYVKSFTGTWVIDGLRLWLPLNEAPIYNKDASNTGVLIKDKVFNQNLQGNNSIYLKNDTPYITDTLDRWTNKCNGYSDKFSIYTDGSGQIDQYLDNIDIFIDFDAIFIPNDGPNIDPYVMNESHMEIWVKRTSDGAIATIGEHSVSHKNAGWIWYFDATDHLVFEIFDDTGTALISLTSTNTVTADGNWHKLVILRKADRIAMYIDNVRESIGTTTGQNSIYYAGIILLKDKNYANGFVGNVKDFVMGTTVFYKIDIEEASSELPELLYAPRYLMLE